MDISHKKLIKLTWNPQESYGTFWNLLESDIENPYFTNKINLNYMESSRTLWNLMEPSGIF